MVARSGVSWLGRGAAEKGAEGKKEGERRSHTAKNGGSSAHSQDFSAHWKRTTLIGRRFDSLCVGRLKLFQITFSTMSRRAENVRLILPTLSIVLIVSLCVQSSQAFQCYVCDSKSDIECTENLPATTRLVPQDCVDITGVKYCIKTTNIYAGESES